jgi:excisionase family DNA binding protein
VTAELYLTTLQVAEAVGVSKTTLLRWVEQAVMPKPNVIHGGRRGRVARWPLYAPKQGQWVKAQLDDHLTWDEIRRALERHDPFAPSNK